MGFPSCNLVRSMLPGRRYTVLFDTGPVLERPRAQGTFVKVDGQGYVVMVPKGSTRQRPTGHWTEVTGVLTRAEAREYQIT